MSGVTLTFDAQDALSRLWDARTEMMRPAPLLRSMGERLLAFHQQRFTEQISPEGVPWQELSARYQKRKRKNADKVLTRDGYLRNTLRWQVNADELLFGTNRVYGAIHQFGGRTRPHVIEPRYKKALAFGGAVRKSVQHPGSDMPARPFLGLSEADRNEIVEIALDFMQRRM